jgi:hypothetical protein
MQAQTKSLLSYSAPAALATHARKGLSESYRFFSTHQLVEALETDNWQVVTARQAGGRFSDPAYRKHEVIIADRAQFQKAGSEIGEFPRVILTNSHDGNAAAKLQAGLWRMICSNGIVISDGFIQSRAIRHTRRTIEEVILAAQALRTEAGRIGEHVVKFKEVELTPAAAVEFAKQALALRFPKPVVGRVIQPQDVLALQRTEDAQNSLWNVFNRTQEWLLKGGFPITRVGPFFESSTHKARPVNGIEDSSKLNTGLWDLAEQFSRN